MERRAPFSDALERFQDRPIVTIGCGTTCGCLGDERNLREFLVADQTAEVLREAGHAVISLLIDDSLDPLSYRQLRIAFNKDEERARQWSEWCGKPLAHVPDPWDCHPSYAAHFEDALLERLRSLGCCPNLISTAGLYERGIYAPYVHQVLSRYDEIMEFLTTRFSGYQPESLFRVLCADCGRMDETSIENSGERELRYSCRHCDTSRTLPLDEVRGKLNWKLDCAVRWVLFNIDAEPFSKAYLEPRTGSFVVAQEISKTFFGGHDVLPLRYGLVRIDKALSFRLLDSLPPDVLRRMFVERPPSDMHITADLVMNTASRYKLEYGLSYLDCVKQLVPMWLLRPQALSDRQAELVSRGIRFAETFLNQEIAVQLPGREAVECIEPGNLSLLRDLIASAVDLRKGRGLVWEGFCEPAKELVMSLGERRQEVIGHLRAIIGQKQGVPPSRLLYLLPIDYLQALEYVLDLRMGCVETDAGVRLRERAAA